MQFIQNMSFSDTYDRGRWRGRLVKLSKTWYDIIFFSNYLTQYIYKKVQKKNLVQAQSETLKTYPEKNIR